MVAGEKSWQEHDIMQLEKKKHICVQCSESLTLIRNRTESKQCFNTTLSERSLLKKINTYRYT